jgi:hypothetical protein
MLPVYLEVPGVNNEGPNAEEIRKLRELHARWAPKKPKRKRAAKQV